LADGFAPSAMGSLPEGPVGLMGARLGGAFGRWLRSIGDGLSA